MVGAVSRFTFMWGIVLVFLSVAAANGIHAPLSLVLNWFLFSLAGFVVGSRS